jgi:hypothetical protein
VSICLATAARRICFKNSPGVVGFLAIFFTAVGFDEVLGLGVRSS